MKYFEDFSSWEDVKSNFAIDRAEPEEVIAARYNTGNYEGDAFVCYREGEKFYTVSGSHCSCYGLEGQWEPEEYDAETLLAAFKRSEGWGSQASCAQMVMARVSEYIAALSKATPTAPQPSKCWSGCTDPQCPYTHPRSPL